MIILGFQCTVTCSCHVVPLRLFDEVLCNMTVPGSFGQDRQANGIP